MPSDQLFKILSAAKLPLTVAAFGVVLNLSSSNAFIKNTGASLATAAVGAAVVAAGRKDEYLTAITELEQSHADELDALSQSADDEITELEASHADQVHMLRKAADAAIANSTISKSMVDYQTEVSAKLKSELKQLDSQLKAIADERDRARNDVNTISFQLSQASVDLSTCHADKSYMAGQLETWAEERMQLIYELYETAVTEMHLGNAIVTLETKFSNDTAYQVGQKKKLKSAVTKARADFHTQITDAQTRINQLETALAEKEAIAKAALLEVGADSRGHLSNFSGKMSAQNEMISGLKTQIDELRKTNTALTLRRFDDVGTDNIRGNDLIDKLAKQGSIYGAWHHEREGHNGRLKVWLTMVDAPLSRAKDALEDLEAELKLWAKPDVKVDRGMHLFTLATEQEHKVLAAPNVPLTRLEKTLDNAIHARIVGGSGSGKTVLLHNLMHYMAATMKGANVTLLDPKAVDDWGLFTPRYWGEECVTGIVDLADSLKGRVANTVTARKAGKPAPEYSPELFVLDEAQYNFLLAQNADDSYIKDRGETPPNFAKKAKGALAGLLSLGRAYNAIGLFVTQLPQVSKVGLNEGSFDPCVNIFLGKQIDSAIDSFLPASGFTDSKCKSLEKEADTRRKLGQKWIMLIADLPKSEAYLMECPAPGYYHNRFSRDLGTTTETVESGENRQRPVSNEIEPGERLAGVEPSPIVYHPSTAAATTVKHLSAHCPDCSHKSIKPHGTKPQPNGKYRFVCENADCDKSTFRALPLA